MAKPVSSRRDGVRLRHRAEGHLRFELPVALCEEPMARRLEQRIGRLEGVYRVTLYRRQRKLSIRHMTEVIGFHRLILALDQAIAEIDGTAPATPASATPAKAFKDRLLTLPLVQRAQAKYQQAKFLIEGASHLVNTKLGRPSGPPMSTERFSINFLNDLVSFYLIKLHWDRITKEWLKQPLKYRYQWLSLFYLVFLMVRYRKAGAKK